MSTKIGDGQIYTTIGTILNAQKGIVEFSFQPAAVDMPGEGTYDIQGEDSYIYTYDKGKFTLLDDLTV
jgi:hypothetical protein